MKRFNKFLVDDNQGDGSNRKISSSSEENLDVCGGDQFVKSKQKPHEINVNEVDLKFTNQDKEEIDGIYLSFIGMLQMNY